MAKNKDSGVKIDLVELKNILNVLPEKSFLFYSLKEDKIIENSNKFKIEDSIIKMGEFFRKIEELSLSGIYISVLEEEYSSVIDMEKSVEFIFDFQEGQSVEKVEVKDITFVEKNGKSYKFYISFGSNVIKDIIEKNINSIIRNKKLELINLAERDEI